MFHALVRSALRYIAVLALGATSIVPVLLGAPAVTANPAVYPLVSDMQLVSSSTTPPSQADCNALGRRCFTPTAGRRSQRG